ncbi:MAG: response regulator transcription factor [Luteolibacter sp.]
MNLLLAEDDTVTRESLAELLDAEGYVVHAARDGTEAIALWEKFHPELVLLDIMMPGATGYEVCRRIRQDDPRVPLLFLSAKSEEIDIVLGLELGADDFVRKPFGKHELLARLRAALRRNVPERQAQGGRFGPWTVQSRHLRAIHDDGRSIDLSPREVKILNLLASRIGEVVNRDELLNQCWGLEHYPESRTLDQHMLNLRKKLEADPSKPSLIETVRGAGYRFPGS